MLGADDAAGTTKKTDTTATPDQDAPPDRPKTTAGRRVARTAGDAVEATERMLCGTAVVRSAAVAEGLALHGQPVATLLRGAARSSGIDVRPSVDASWVHHRLSSSSAHGFAFELSAAGAQDAVDHCLVAHRIAARIGRAGVCTLADRAADGVELVRLPDDRVIAEARSRSDAGNTGVNSSPLVVLDVAREELDRVSAITGRPIGTVSRYRMDDAGVCLVCDGAAGTEAREIVDGLRSDGIACGMVAVRLPHPFPTEDVRDAVAGLRSIGVVPGSADPSAGENLLARVGAAIGVSDVPRVSAATVRDDLGLPPSDYAGPGLPDRVETGAAGVLVAAVPAGGWGETFLLDVAGLLGGLAQFDLTRTSDVAGLGTVLALGRGSFSTVEAPVADALFVGHPALLGASSAIARVREGGGVVVVAPTGGARDWWSRLPLSVRLAIAKRGVRLRWLDLSTVQGLDFSDEPAVRAVMHGAFLRVDADLAGVVGCRSDVVAALAGGDVERTRFDQMSLGAKCCEEVDVEALEESSRKDETDFRESPDLPAMPEPAGDSTGEEWKRPIRHFHLTGTGARSLADPTSTSPLVPAVLAGVQNSIAEWQDYPRVVWDVAAKPAAGDAEARSPAGVEPLFAIVEQTIDQLKTSGHDVSIVSQNIARLVWATGSVLRRPDAPETWDGLLKAAVLRFLEGFDLSDSGSSSLVDETRRLRERLEVRLADATSWVALDRDAVLRQYVAAIRRQRRPRRAALIQEIGALVERLEELLRIDDSHGPEGSKPEAISATLGEAGGAFLDSSRLAKNLPRHGSKRLDPGRRHRIECTLGSLRHHLENEPYVPEVVVVQPDPAFDAESVSGARVIGHPAGLEAAIGLFEGLADEGADLFRTVRTARLEIDAAFDPEVHDPVLARFQWQAMTEDELLALPPVVVLETEARLRGGQLAAFSEVLRSGRPVHVLVTQSTLELRSGDRWEALGGFHPGLGYVAVAHREAMVLESSLGIPDHLEAGLDRVASTLRPAVALVAVPSWAASVPPWRQLAAAHQGRANPCFVYDPEAGAHWADRFDLSSNPQPDLDWPEHDLGVVESSGEPGTRTGVFTFADAVALDPAYRDQFRIVPPEAWSTEQMELSEYLSSPWGAMVRKVPFIWVAGDDGILTRAILTRELAFASRDRVRAWKILQELAGTDNEYARRAAEAARKEARVEAEGERADLETSHAAEIERVRAEAAGEAMNRLVQVLMNVDALPSPATLPVATATPAPEMIAAEPAEAAVAVEPEEEEEEVGFTDPYIDSFLCTSCNDCRNINPRLFKYDANKQAFIDDPTSGTFEELVKGAEKCPARCIHPGAPRSDDPTANDDLVARAAKFN